MAAGADVKRIVRDGGRREGVEAVALPRQGERLDPGTVPIAGVAWALSSSQNYNVDMLAKKYIESLAGKTIGVQVIFWDVTHRKQAEAALEQERYLLHALMDNLPHNIYFKDAQSRFIRINKALAECFELDDAATALGKTDFDFFTDEHANKFSCFDVPYTK